MPTIAELFNQAVYHHQSGHLGLAENFCRQILQVDPRHGHAWHLLGIIAGRVGRPDAAVECIGQALRFIPDYAPAHNNLGKVLRDQGKLEAAEACCREALRLMPDLAEAHGNLGVVLLDRGVVLQNLGRLDEAEQTMRAALRHHPRLAGAWNQLATLRRGRLPDADLDAMRRLRAGTGLTPLDRAALGFGLAQILDARQEFEEAGEQLIQANALTLDQSCRRGQGYDPAAHTQFVDRLLAAFSPAFFERVRGLGVDSELPIFIVGLPRSGTTLTEQILASHPHVFGAGELPLAHDTFLRLAGNGGDDARALDGLARLDGPTIRGLADWHLDKLRTLHEGARHVADKMTENYLILGFLAALFPRAKLIHCRRDLRDIAVSCWMNSFRAVRWANAFEHIAARFHDYERVMNHWRQVLPVPVLEVDYEETVADLEGVARRLVSWCGLEWEPACLKFHEHTRPVRTASAMQVRQPIFQQSVARWKHYEKSLGPLFALLPLQTLRTGAVNP